MHSGLLAPLWQQNFPLPLRQQSGFDARLMQQYGGVPPKKFNVNL